MPFPLPQRLPLSTERWERGLGGEGHQPAPRVASLDSGLSPTVIASVGWLPAWLDAATPSQ